MERPGKAFTIGPPVDDDRPGPDGLAAAERPGLRMSTPARESCWRWRRRCATVLSRIGLRGRNNNEMTTVTMDNEIVAIEPTRHVLRLHPAAAGAQIKLQYGVSTSTPQPKNANRPFHFAADLHISKRSSQRERMVCRLDAGHLVTPSTSGTAASLTLTGLITNQQLREIEHIRGSGDLFFHLTISATTVIDGSLRTFGGDEHLPMPAGEWTPQIDMVKAGTFVEVLVPMPTVKTYADAVDFVREGRELLREGDDSAHIDSALIRARKAIEPIRKKLRTVAVAKNASSDPTQRSLAEREAILIEALVSYIAGAAHNDAITKTFEYTNTNAITALAAAAGLIRSISESA